MVEHCRLKSRVQENVQRLKNARLRFSFRAHIMLLSWVSVIIPGALKLNRLSLYDSQRKQGLAGHQNNYADEPSLWTS